MLHKKYFVQTFLYLKVHFSKCERDDIDLDFIRALLRDCVSIKVYGDQIPSQNNHLGSLGVGGAHQPAAADCHHNEQGQCHQHTLVS